MINEFEDQNVAKAMKFISVVCIIAFLINGINLIRNTFMYNFPQEAASALVQGIKTDQVMFARIFPTESDQQTAFAPLNQLATHFTAPIVKKWSLFGLGTTFLCLLGILVLRKFKKLGFHLFLIGTLVSILAEFTLFGGNGYALWSGITDNLLSIIFIILFARKLKYMS